MRSPVCWGRWFFTGLLLLAIGSILAAHGGAHEAPRPLPLLTSIAQLDLVPAFRDAGSFSDDGDMRDIAPILARRLGLALPTADGKTLLP